MIEAHNLTHLPAAAWCEICVQARGKVIDTRKSSTTVRFCVCRWISSSSPVSLCGVPRHRPKATVLTMVDMDSGYVGVLMVFGKSPDNFTVRSSSSFVDKLRAEKTRLRYDNELWMRLLAEKIAAFRHPRTTILEPINRAGHQRLEELKEHTRVFKLQRER